MIAAVLIFGLSWWNAWNHPDWKRWETMDEQFNTVFKIYSDRPLELEVEANRMFSEAHQSENCEQALIALSLKFRADMMLQRQPTPEDWQLQLPQGCSSNYPRIQYDIANRLLQAGESDQAEARLLSITDAPKWASHAWNLVGMIRLNRNDLSGAMIAYMEAQKAVSDIPNPSIYMNLGQVAARGNAWEEALHWFGLASEAQTWNEHRPAYTFVYDIRPILDANRLRAAINSRDTTAADAAWRDMWPTELTNRPLLQIRTMLDYLFWRQRGELIPGVVRFFEDVVQADSARAEDSLNDRVLLFEPWRQKTGWSLERTLNVLELAESNPALRMEVPNFSSARNLPKITFAKVMWVRRGVGLLVVLAMGWALWQFCWIVATNQMQKRAEMRSDHELIEALLSPSNRMLGEAWRREVTGVLASRLKRTDIENVIPEALFNRLTLREVQILRWIILGHSSQNIASELNVSVQYVYNIRSELRRKLEMEPGEDWSQLIATAQP
jgi:predicted negative regulator of RcsB-dependent stress response